ncbi:uncharacterized protein [Dermacentor albipictus]|uniref:uncharacterized protein n=1 Tax=Dermacentor albipictus TaxID=60249 RepID=UPI0038FC4557
MIPHFPSVTAVYSAASNKDIQCLHAQLTQYDDKAGRATYVWFITDKARNEKTIIFNIREGDSPEYVTFVTTDDPGHTHNATVPYTDYDTCFILKFDGMSDSCSLWVNNEFKDDVPDFRVRKYKKSCGKGTSIYDQKICNE